MHSWAPSFEQELQAQGHGQRKGFSREAEFMLLALCYEDGRRSKSNEPLQNTGATVQAGWNAVGRSPRAMQPGRSVAKKRSAVSHRIPGKCLRERALAYPIGMDKPQKPGNVRIKNGRSQVGVNTTTHNTVILVN